MKGDEPMSELSDKMKGQAKETMGKITKNDRQKTEGTLLKARGEAKDRLGNMRDRLADERKK